MLKKISLIALGSVLSLSVFAQGSPDLQKSLQQYPVKTALSKTALQLKLGMTKTDVLKLLGKPTWGDSEKGEPLAWSWRNGKCAPVAVMFDDDMKVKGFDQGRSRCGTNTYRDVPGDQYLCSKKDREKFCE